MSEELEKYFKDMFTSVDKNIVLDDDQIKAIMNDDKYVLILAGAGTGKTTTMVGKVKYLVDIKNVDPEKILVISYTKKAVQELERLIIDEFGINTNVTTFHSLAYKYVRKIFFNRKCQIIDWNEEQKIFYDYMNYLFKEKKISELIDTFNADTLKNKYFFYGKFFLENYEKYDSYDKFFSEYKKYKIEEAKNAGIKKKINEWVDKRLNNDEFIVTLKGEVVKSAGEAIIANFLFKHGIAYSYEKVYSEIMEDRKIYKPDFTLDLAGSEFYLEYFGMDDLKYNINKQKKIKFHEMKGNNFIYLDSTPLNLIESKLDELLKKSGFIYNDLTDEEIYNQILDNNKLSPIFKLKDLFYNTVKQIKESINREQYKKIVDEYINNLTGRQKIQAIKQFNFINNFYIFYSKQLYGSSIYSFDYSDLIHYANKYIANKEFINDLEYEYIIIDEYQDISDGEYELARKTSDKHNSKVFAVGDDWQSIYSFRGSNISYITKFDKYFENPTILSIRKTYRNSQELVDIAGSFIKKNESQIDKDLISLKTLPRPIHFMTYDDRTEDEKIDDHAEYRLLKRLIKEIHSRVPEHKILILARKNKMIDNCFKFDSDFIDDLGTKIKLAHIDDLEMDGMTIHKSKGLTYDEVIIIGMNKEFPSIDHYTFWLINLFKPKKIKEPISYAEERRILYVALTRTKNNVFILVNKNPKNRSSFIDELIQIEKEVKEE